MNRNGLQSPGSGPRLQRHGHSTCFTARGYLHRLRCKCNVASNVYGCVRCTRSASSSPSTYVQHTCHEWMPETWPPITAAPPGRHCTHAMQCNRTGATSLLAGGARLHGHCWFPGRAVPTCVRDGPVAFCELTRRSGARGTVACAAAHRAGRPRAASGGPPGTLPCRKLADARGRSRERELGLTAGGGAAPCPTMRREINVPWCDADGRLRPRGWGRGGAPTGRRQRWSKLARARRRPRP